MQYVDTPSKREAATVQALERAQARAAKAKAALAKAEAKAKEIQARADAYTARRDKRQRTAALIALGLVLAAQYRGSQDATRANWMQYISSCTAIDDRQRTLALQHLGG